MSEAELRQLVRPFRDFVAGIDPAGHAVVLCHSDADGLAAGAILARTLQRVGHQVVAEVTGKGEGAWSPSVAARLARLAPDALLVADLGCRPEPVLPGVPTLFVDHHRPEGVPPGATLITGYGADPTPTSGLLAYECGRLLTDASDMDWIAAVSLLADIGDAAPFPLLAEARKRHKITPLRNAAALLNAPRRSASGDATPALDLLLKATGPKNVTEGDYLEVAVLREAKDEVAVAFAEAKRAAPVFAGTVALVRVHSPCQVHPMVAQIWRTRLTKQVVIVANTGYLPGRVNFAVRSASGVNLLDFLRENAPAGAGPEYGHGHDLATGGSLPVPAWNEFITRLGFGAEAQVSEPEAAGVVA